MRTILLLLVVVATASTSYAQAATSTSCERDYQDYPAVAPTANLAISAINPKTNSTWALPSWQTNLPGYQVHPSPGIRVDLSQLCLTLGTNAIVPDFVTLSFGIDKYANTPDRGAGCYFVGSPTATNLFVLDHNSLTPGSGTKPFSPFVSGDVHSMASFAGPAPIANYKWAAIRYEGFGVLTIFLIDQIRSLQPTAVGVAVFESWEDSLQFITNEHDVDLWMISVFGARSDEELGFIHTVAEL